MIIPDITLPKTVLNAEKAVELGTIIAKVYEQTLFNPDSEFFLGDVDQVADEYTEAELFGGLLTAETILHNTMHEVTDPSDGINLIEMNNLNNIFAQVMVSRVLLDSVGKSNEADLNEAVAVKENELVSLTASVAEVMSEDVIQEQLSEEAKAVMQRLTGIGG